MWGGGALPGRGRWQWEGALGVPGRARPWAGPPSPLLSPRRDRREPRSLQGEPGMRGDGCQSLLSPPRGVLLPPQEGPSSSPRPDPALCPPVQQLGWNQLRDAGPRGAADAAHHGAGTGGSPAGWGGTTGDGTPGVSPSWAPSHWGWFPGWEQGHAAGPALGAVAALSGTQHWDTGGPQGCEGAAQPGGHSPVPPNSPVPSLPSNAGSSPNTPRRCAPGEAWPCSLWGASWESPPCPHPHGRGEGPSQSRVSSPGPCGVPSTRMSSAEQSGFTCSGPPRKWESGSPRSRGHHPVEQGLGGLHGVLKWG